MCRPMASVACGLLALLLLASPEANAIGAQQDAANRTWTSSKGTYVKAKFVRAEGLNVVLLKEDGNELSVPISQLSRLDREYVTKQIDAAKTANDAPAPDPGKVGGVGGISEQVLRCQELCEQLTKSYKAADPAKKPTIAVVEFSDLSGGVTDLGRLISEELITKLFSTGDYKVIERFLLNKAIAEHELQLQGMVDPKSAKELGKILGVDSIVSGTIADMNDSLRVNARLISTETGEVFSVAAVTIRKNDSVTAMAGSSGVQPVKASSTGRSSGSGGKAQFPYREDFSKYEDDGQNTDWGRNGRVSTGVDGRKWLIPSGNGPKTVGLDIELPESAYIEFDYSTQLSESGGMRSQGRALSGISLVDEAGAKYRIEWVIDIVYDAWSQNRHHMRLPGGSEQSRDFFPSTGTVKIRKAGDRVTVTNGGIELTGNVSDFKRFTRFEVDVYKGQNAVMGFTNFQIGKPQ